MAEAHLERRTICQNESPQSGKKSHFVDGIGKSKREKVAPTSATKRPGCRATACKAEMEKQLHTENKGGRHVGEAST